MWMPSFSTEFIAPSLCCAAVCLICLCHSLHSRIHQKAGQGLSVGPDLIRQESQVLGICGFKDAGMCH